MKIKTIIGITAIVALSACGGEVSFPEQKNANSSLSGSSLHFAETLYPILTERCTNCHGTNQAPLIALKSSPSESYSAVIDGGLVDFNSPGTSKIVRKVGQGHNCWGDCQDNENTLRDAIIDWKSRNDADTASANSIKTAPLTVPADLPTSIPDLANMSFPLTGLVTGIPAGALLNFKLRKFDDESYQVSDMRIISTAELYVKNVNILVNGARVDPTSAYSLIDTAVPAQAAPGFSISGASTLMSIGFGLPSGTGGPGIDQIIVEFQQIGTPTSVQEQRFAAVRTIINTSCGGGNCHGNTRSATFTINGFAYSEQIPAFANFAAQADYLNRSLGINSDGSSRLLIVPGNVTNSYLYRAVAHQDGTHTFNDINRPMPFQGTYAPPATRAAYATTISEWITNYAP